MVVVVALGLTLWLVGAETAPSGETFTPAPVTAPDPAAAPASTPVELPPESPATQTATTVDVVPTPAPLAEEELLDLDTELQRLGIADIDPEARAIVDGRVVDGLEQPRPLTMVTLFNRRGEHLTASFTDDSGRFHFESSVPLLAGWSVSTSIEPTLTEDDPEASAPAAYIHTADLRPGEDPVEVTLVVAPAPRLEGLVINGDTGAPVTFAMVEVLSRASAWRATSQLVFTEVDASFSIALTEVPSNDLLIRAGDAEGRQVIVGPLSLSPGEVRWIELRLQAPLSLSGRVVDGHSGESLAGARVTAMPTHPLIDRQLRRTVCDGEGRFTLRGLTASTNRLLLHAVAEGHAAALITVTDPAQSLEIRLGAPVTLSGTVHDATSALTVRFASVTCALPMMEAAGPSWTDTALCDEQGHFELPLRNVPPAAALLLVDSPGHLLSRRPLVDLVPLQLGSSSYTLRIDLARTHSR